MKIKEVFLSALLLMLFAVKNHATEKAIEHKANIIISDFVLL